MINKWFFFENSKFLALKYLNESYEFLFNLNKRYYNPTISNKLPLIQGILNKIKNLQSGTLNLIDSINLVNYFLVCYLSYSEISNQVKLFFDFLLNNPKTLMDLEPILNINDYSEKVKQVDEEIKFLSIEFTNQGGNLIAFKSIITAIVEFAEVIEYHYYNKYKLLDINKKYNFEEIFSIGRPVDLVNGTQITELRALRNSLSHRKYQVDDSLILHINNTDKGINYNRSFSFDEFVNLFNSYIIMYKFYGNLGYLRNSMPFIPYLINE